MGPAAFLHNVSQYVNKCVDKITCFNKRVTLKQMMYEISCILWIP